LRSGHKASALGAWFIRSGKLANAGMRDSFGIVLVSGKPGEKPGEKRKHCKASVRGLEARG